ncbi:uncharacterized protein BX664DRAFT_357716 [Halteromyces radiatus]|uniref:uncharacterized protein n=1 Tax=Halteromyces radiatus TaxID=101107 RepID=UPI00221F94F6|nr:uncharacterized protein BX664DRAFT_357716 [Halteromyces radiatus]KAI8093258.1 hypothetical protein BX664DRAFT_357716 [Halteromyces radiatus]
MTEINFEYFDPQVELGTLDENGRPIRPRKKPGRKPNPPSPAQRKAQNRAAQRAFRERKRREMHDAETNIKKCIQQRDQALREVNSLQRTVKQLRYENNYLKGMMLTLKLACFSHGINVPKFWNTGSTDNVGSDILSLSKTEGIPQNLEFFLDNNLHIINKSPEFVPAGNSPTTSSTYQQQQQQPTNTILSTTTSNTTIPDTFMTTPSSHFYPTPTDLSSFMSPTYSPAVVTPDFITTSTEPQQPQQQQQQQSSKPMDDLFTLLNDPSSKTSSWSPSNTNHTFHSPHTSKLNSTMAQQHHLGSSLPTSLSDSTKHIFPPMSALDAINYLRRINRERSYTRSVFTPTELQRTVPHDTRIDYVPGPLIRDHMIVFQGYYDANALFSFLIKQSVFLGGELGNPDCWFVPPSFFQTYWFLMPNHRPRRIDNAIEMAVTQGRTLSRMMFQRKKMYLDREKFADYFPPINNNGDNMIKSSRSNNANSRKKQGEDDDGSMISSDRADDSDGDPWENILTDDDPVRCDDVPLDVVMDLMKTLPKMSPPNVFSF